MPSERENMLTGELYDPLDPELVAMRQRARELCHRFNTATPTPAVDQHPLLVELLGQLGRNSWIEPPFHCDYGSNLYLDDNVFFNFNCIVLDVAPVHIGHHSMFGPAVQIYTATHPVSAEERRKGLEYAKPIKVGADVWVGGGTILCPGVTIGDGAVIGAGSVVTRDIPANVVAAGNPCRVLRSLSQ
jgi:maltose O-acetyltransferase